MNTAIARIFLLLLLFLGSTAFQVSLPLDRQRDVVNTLHASRTSPSITASPTKVCSFQEARKIIETDLYPKSELGTRVRLGRDAMGVKPGEALTNHDKRNHYTYGEFPLESFDRLVDCALAHYKEMNPDGMNAGIESLKLVDIGSGCGRIALHCALSRAGFDVHGVEISDLMHGYASSIIKRGVKIGDFRTTADALSDSSASQVELHCGAAQGLPNVFQDADIIFAYCSVWPDAGFAIEERAMLMGNEMSTFLSQACKKGCVAITTDRLLNKEFGWKYVDQLDVENPETFGSLGYISILTKDD